MVKRANLEVLRESLLESIESGRDSQDLLEGMARAIGGHLGVSACLLIAFGHSSAPIAEGFWHEDNRSLALAAPDIASLSEATLTDTGRGICLSEIRDRDLGWWKTIAPLESSWAIPIAFRGVRNGIAIIGIRNVRRVTGKEPELLAAIGNTLGIAYETLPGSADLLPSSGREEISSRPTGSRDRLVTANPILTRLYEAIRQQAEQQRKLLDEQRQLNEIKDDIIAAISDRARNPLATMKMAINALSDETRQLPPSSRENFWRILKDEWNTLNQLINNIVTLKQLESRDIAFRPHPVNLDILVREATQPFQERWSEDRRKCLQLTIDCYPGAEQVFLETDPQHLRTILHELLSNAGNFAFKETMITIKVMEREDGTISISVADIGLGVSPEEEELIFEPFRRGKGITDRAIAGTGIGLAIVKGLLDILNGRISVTSHPIEEDASPDRRDAIPHRTVFTIILPRSPSGRGPS